MQYITKETGVNYLKDDLDTKNYNDLIVRKMEGGQPLVLIVVILFGQNTPYIQVESNLEFANAGLHLNALAYWYCPDENEPLTKTFVRNELRFQLKIYSKKISAL